MESKLALLRPLTLSGTAGSVASLLMVAATVIFGLHMIRNLMVGLVFYLRDVEGLDSLAIGAIALGLFLGALLTIVVIKSLRSQAALVIIVAGLGALRVASHYTDRAGADLALAMIGSAFFLWFLAMSPLAIKVEGRTKGAHLAVALLLGISADTAIRGGFGTLDPSWASGIGPDAVVLTLVVVQWLLLWPYIKAGPAEPACSSVARALPLVALGPVLALELLVFQNIGLQTVLTSWEQPTVLIWILGANLVGLLLVAASAIAGSLKSPPLLALLGVVLVLTVVDERSGLLAGALILIGHGALALMLVAAATGSIPSETGSSPRGISLSIGVGMLLFLALLFVYYASYDMAILIPREVIAPIAAGLVALLGIIGGLRWRWTAIFTPSLGAPILASVLLLAVPVTQLFTIEKPEAVEGQGFPVRVMSYNLHQGFSAEGRLNLETLARVIEGENPDVVALQEISRGWVVDGSVDMLVWLSRRLDMPYLWGPAADSVWGNAILSRYPVVDAETFPMPNNRELRLKRAFTSVRVDIGGEQALNVIATHLHHLADEGHRRVVQVEAILESWAARDQTVILGDFNARPWDPEMTLMREADLRDAFVASEADGDGFTSNSLDPFQRIDYIWISSDLKPRDFSITQSLASDHLPIAVTVFTQTPDRN